MFCVTECVQQKETAAQGRESDSQLTCEAMGVLRISPTFRESGGSGGVV